MIVCVDLCLGSVIYVYNVCISLSACVAFILSVAMGVVWDRYLHNVITVSSTTTPARISEWSGFLECTIPWNFRIWSKYLSFQIFTNVYIVKCNMSIGKLCSCLAFYDYIPISNNTHRLPREIIC